MNAGAIFKKLGVRQDLGPTTHVGAVLPRRQSGDSIGCRPGPKRKRPDIVISGFAPLKYQHLFCG